MPPFYTYISAGGASLDPDAEAYLTASGLLGDPIIEPAINTAILSMKAANFYSASWSGYTGVGQKLIRMWHPNKGGSATTCKWNAANPLDTDAAFRSTYIGGLTFDSQGIIGAFNGSYNSHLNFVGTVNNFVVGRYSYTPTITNSQEVNFNYNPAGLQIMINTVGANRLFCVLGGFGIDTGNVTGLTYDESISLVREPTQGHVIKNSTVLKTVVNSANPTDPGTNALQIMSTGATGYTGKFGSVWVLEGMTTADVATWHSIINIFESNF